MPKPILVKTVLPGQAGGPAGGWQFARWGMSLAEVQSGSDSAAILIPEDRQRAEGMYVGRTCKLQMTDAPPVAGLQVTKVNFCFDGQDRLTAIDMYFAGDDFIALDRALASRLGAPVASDDGRFPERTYRGEGDTLQIMRLMSTVLSYSDPATGF